MYIAVINQKRKKYLIKRKDKIKNAAKKTVKFICDLKSFRENDKAFLKLSCCACFKSLRCSLLL